MRWLATVGGQGRGYSTRWNKLLESGRYGSAGELAAAEKINPSYVSWVVRLDLLPDIVESITEGRQADNIEADILSVG